mgnify:CR=1 FL=1
MYGETFQHSFFYFLALLKFFIQKAAIFSELRSYIKLVHSLCGIDISLGSEIVCMEITEFGLKYIENRFQVSGRKIIG